MTETFNDLTKARKSLMDKMSEVPRTIVYIDSDTSAINAFRDYFTLQQYNIKTFVDPLEAFLWIKSNTVDLVISEIELPMLSGVSLLRKLRLHDKTAKIPFIMVTRNVVKYIPDARNANANDLYPKPLDFEKLHKRIKYLSKIQIENDVNMTLLQKTWSRRIYPGHVKRLLGITFATLMLVASFPILLLIYSYLKIRYKSAITMVDRIGGGYELLQLYHFDTSHDDKFSKFLYRYNIYRWPELLNVIIGDMTLVGNKPLHLDIAQQYTSDRNSLRFLAPTGMTGNRHVYDVSNKKTLHVASEIENDYAMNRSFFYDVVIFLKTIPYLFRTSNDKYLDL